MKKILSTFILFLHFVYANSIPTSIENIPFPVNIENVKEWSIQNNYLYTKKKVISKSNSNYGGGHNPIGAIFLMPIIITEYFMNKSLFQVTLFKEEERDKILFYGTYDLSNKLVYALILKNKIYSHYYLFDLKELGESLYFKLYENIDKKIKIDISSQINILNLYKTKYDKKVDIYEKSLLVGEAIKYFGKESSSFVEYTLKKDIGPILLNEIIEYSCEENDFGQESFPLEILYKNIKKQNISSESIVRLIRICDIKEKLNEVEIQILKKKLFNNYCYSDNKDIKIYEYIKSLYEKEIIVKNDLYLIKDTIKLCNQSKNLLIESLFSLKIDQTLSIKDMNKSELKELLKNIDIKTNKNIFFEAINYLDKNYILEKLFKSHFIPNNNQTTLLVETFLKPEYKNTSLFGLETPHNPEEYKKQFYILSLLYNSRSNNVKNQIAIKTLHNALQKNKTIEKSLLLLGLAVLGEENYFNEAIKVSNVGFNDKLENEERDVQIAAKFIKLFLGKNLKSILLDIGKQLGCSEENIIELSKTNEIRIKDICNKY